MTEQDHPVANYPISKNICDAIRADERVKATFYIYGFRIAYQEQVFYARRIDENNFRVLSFSDAASRVALALIEEHRNN